MGITVEQWDEPTSVGNVGYVKLTNGTGASVTLSAMGAGVIAVCVPDRNGVIADVAMGYDTAESYAQDPPNSGKTCGRFANRIVHGKLSIDGRDYQLDVNCGEHHLHGGLEGFQHRLWDMRVKNDATVVFQLQSPDGDQHYPGCLNVKVTYRWDDDCRLSISYEAETDAPTVVNLTNHTYFNLAGHDSGSALGHRLTLNCSKVMDADSTMAPTGLFRDVAGTPMDFSPTKDANAMDLGHKLGERISDDYDLLKTGKGYDHCWLIDDYEPGSLRQVAKLSEECSGRRLIISTTQPGVQLYTANWLTGSTPIGKGGRVYNDYDFVALECQGLPDAPNHENFPSQILKPGEKYFQVIQYLFDTF